MFLLGNLLKRFVQSGQLTVIDASGMEHRFAGGGEGPSVTIKLHEKALERSIFFNPELKVAEAYMDGTLSFEDGSKVTDLLNLFSVNRTSLGQHPVQKALRRVWKLFRTSQQSNKRGEAAHNVQHHYDIGNDLYKLFLDEDMQYTCAYFTDPEMSLEDAQLAKKRHVAAKLDLKPGMSVAELGSGWGGLAIYLAKAADVKVTAVNVSKEQIALSRERAEKEGVADRVTFVEADYRELEGTYDRVVSVGMLEHVGVQAHDEYFTKVQSLLKDDGFAMIHAIGRKSPPGTTSPFIRKYIFPGGYAPAMSEVFASLERVGLWACDCEILRLHYAYTIRHWLERFTANRDQAAEMYDERFCRMWEFYLAAVELGFIHGSNMIFQLLLSKERDAVPITRDFIGDRERELTIFHRTRALGDRS